MKTATARKVRKKQIGIELFPFPSFHCKILGQGTNFYMCLGRVRGEAEHRRRYPPCQKCPIIRDMVAAFEIVKDRRREGRKRRKSIGSRTNHRSIR